MAKLKLKHEAREYLHFPVFEVPPDLTGNLEIRFPPDTEWTPMEWVTLVARVWSVWDGITGLPTHARVLVAGPDIDPAGGIALPLGDNSRPEMRLASNPEVIIRTSTVTVVVLP